MLPNLRIHRTGDQHHECQNSALTTPLRIDLTCGARPKVRYRDGLVYIWARWRPARESARAQAECRRDDPFIPCPGVARVLLGAGENGA